jgi:hypothetical protein
MRTFIAAFLLVFLVPGCSDDAPVPVDPGEPSASPMKSPEASGRKLATTLTGAEETGPVDTPATGTFVAFPNPGQGLLCYQLDVSGLLAPAVGAHVHLARAGEDGPVVVPLDVSITGSGSGCPSVNPDVLLGIVQAPSNYYVNVHSTLYPGGEIRGQLGD